MFREHAITRKDAASYGHQPSADSIMKTTWSPYVLYQWL